ncbi:Zinc finger A20 and AN1 domain-containing stress-associated protein 3, partial [Linum perenne]
YKQVFCGGHWYSEQHSCGFDFKSLGKEKISKANPVVKGEKLRQGFQISDVRASVLVPDINGTGVAAMKRKKKDDKGKPLKAVVNTVVSYCYG